MTRPDWVDRVNRVLGPAGDPPPRNASTAAWRTYATAAGYEIPDSAGRGDIIDIVDAGPPPPPPRKPGIPKVEGPVFDATRQAVADAEHLTPLDQPAVAVLLDLAKTIDGMDERPATAPVDNVTVPTFRRYLEDLGLTPAARSKLNIKQVKAKSKLGEARQRWGGRAGVFVATDDDDDDD